jgi:hypothetical protein
MNNVLAYTQSGYDGQDISRKPCVKPYSIAWLVLFTLMLGRTCPDRDCEVIFEHQEWQAAYIVVKRCSSPKKPPRLGEIVCFACHLSLSLEFVMPIELT